MNEHANAETCIKGDYDNSTGFKIKFSHLFLFNFVFLLLCYLPNLQMRFSVDTYLRISDAKEDLFFHIKDGRFMSYMITKMQHLFRSPSSLNQRLYFFVFVTLLSLCVCILTRLVVKIIGNQQMLSILLIDFCFVFGFANVLMQEYFCFPETYLQYGIGLILMVFSLCVFLNNHKSIFSILLSTLFLFLSLGSYQIFIQPWLIFAFTFILLKYKNKFNKNFWYDVFYVFFIFVLSVAGTMLTSKMIELFSSVVMSRGLSFCKIIPNTNEIIRKIATCLLHPINSIIGIMLYVIIAILLFQYTLLAKKLLNKQIKLLDFLTPSFIFLFGFCVTFGMHVFMSEIWIVPRVVTGLGFIIPALVLYFISKIPECTSKILVFIFLLFMLNVYYVQSISINQYANNRLDQEYSQNIIYRIREYEKNNNQEIKNVSFCKDKYVTWGYYGNIKFIFGDTNTKEFVCDWGLVPMLNYYSHRNFKKIDMPKEIYEKYFADKNWDYYMPEEQLVFVGDTLHICVY